MAITVVLKICAAVYLTATLFDLLRSRDGRRFTFELLPLVALLIMDVLLASINAGYVTFGGLRSPNLVVLIMFGSILLGIAARYVFYLRGKFSWADLAKPLSISPILLLPLIGSLQSVKDFEALQIVSFALLAFQNGFFWQIVLQRARPKN